MPASSSEARARWRKRKREQRAAHKSKLKETENDNTYDDNEEDDDPDLDPPQNHLENADDPHSSIRDRANQVSRQKESERLADGGLRISEFPIAIKRVVIRPHSSVFGIVDAERASRNGENGGQGHVGLENISYGQLQALSLVPRDCSALLGAHMEETESGSLVIMPPRIISGSGVPKRLGSVGRAHVVPVHSDWFSLNSVHRLERQVVPHFFSGKSTEHTPETYMENRNLIIAKSMENPEKHLWVDDFRGLVSGIDSDDLTRIVRFLDHWGIINYCANSPKHETQKDGTYLSEDFSNGELRVPSAALKSLDSLIKFDRPKCRLKATDAYPELACKREEDSDFDMTIREQLSEHQCHYCSRLIPTVYYLSQKEADVLLCLDCFNEGRFVAGHSSLDFLKVDSMNNYGYVDGDSWSDQETLLLLEGMQLHNENWNKIAVHVGSKSKAQCILHFVRLPLDGAPLENINVPTISGSSNLWHDNHEKSESNSNGFRAEGGDFESKFPFANCENPVMNLVAFLASTLGPRVAAACAHASLASLCRDDKGSPHGEFMNSTNKVGSGSQNDGQKAVATLSAEKVKASAKDGLAAAAVKAKLFADHEEREIQRLSANIVNHQLKRLELKLKQFAEIETLLMRECELMERMRQRIASERALMMSGQFVPTAASRPMGPPSLGPPTTGNSRPQVLGSQNPISGYGNNNQPIHPNMSLMQHQQGMYGAGARFPLSAIQPSPTLSNSNFNPTSNSQPSLGHSMLRPVSGTKSSLG